MINSEVAKSTYLIQAGVTTYPIGFEYHFNPDNTPQVAVKIDDTLAGLNVDFVLSTDKSSIVLIPTPEEEEALTGPLDFSWMDRLVGKHLFVYRDIEFLQNSDYQVGRIDPEQIEKDFDESVMRDQILRQGYVDLAVKVTEACGDAEHAIEIANNASGVAAEALDVAESANEKSDEALTNSETAVDTAVSAKDDARNALTNAGEADAKADQAIGIADGAMEVAGEAMDVATEAKDAVESKQDILTPGANVTIVDNVISSTGAVHSVNGKTGAVNLTIADLGAASADEVATIKNDQDDLGDQVSIIEGKIPGSASTTNQLATASDIRTTNASVTAVGDRVTTLRADMNTGLSDIQTQVTAQASAIAGKIDQQQDAGNAGKALIIGEDGVVVPGEISSGDYLPLAGGRMRGQVWFDYGLVVGTVHVAMQGTNWLRVAITSDYSYSFKDSGFYPESSTQELGASSNPWRRLYTGVINNGEDLIVPTSGGTLARLEDLQESGGGDTIQFEQLPTPSADYAGKILQYVGEDGTYKSGHFYKCVETVEIISGGYTMDGSSITVTVDTDKFLAQNPVWADYGTLMWRADGGVNGWNVFTQDPQLSLTDDELRNTWGVAVNGEDGNPYTGYSASISIQQGGATYLWTEVDFSGEGPDLSNYLKLSGGTMTGPITLEWSGAGTTTNFVSIKSRYTNTSAGTTYSYNLLQFTPSGSAVFYGDITSGNLVPKSSGVSIGDNSYKWFRVYTQSLYNGGVLQLPTTAGTIARVEDIDAAVGDISTALTAIIGE